MVATPEAPPEPLERPLGLLFGAALPAADDLALLVEGYGLSVGGAPDPDPELRTVPLPSFEEAEGELRSAMALCERHSDYNSRDLLLAQLRDTEEDHAYWLEKQLGLIEVNRLFQRFHKAEAEFAVFFSNSVAVDLDVLNRPRDIAFDDSFGRSNPMSDDPRAQHVAD